MHDLPERIGELAAPLSPVHAHVLLNSASIVVLGLSTLVERWESLADGERLEALEPLQRDALELAIGLKQVIRPAL